MTNAESYCSGYAAYWDGYAAFCMDDTLTGDSLAAWRRGYVVARKEDKGR